MKKIVSLLQSSTVAIRQQKKNNHERRDFNKNSPEGVYSSDYVIVIN